MAGRMEMDFSFQPRPGGPQRRRDPSGPWRILVLADLSGSNRPPLAERRPVRVDLDRWDAFLERLQPSLELFSDHNFGDLDDFHPDELFNQLEVFQTLRKSRSRLRDPATFAAEAQQFHSETEVPADASEENESAEDTLQRLFGQARRTHHRTGPGTASSTLDLSGFLKKLMEPHLTPAPDPRQEEMVAAIEQAIATQMRLVLHEPAFQSLESNLRAIRLLVDRIEMDGAVQLSVFDVSQEELRADLAANSDPLQSHLYRQLLDQQSGSTDATAWSVWIGAFECTAKVEDVQLLAGLAQLAALDDCAFVASAHPSLVGAQPGKLADSGSWQPVHEQVATTWAALRSSPLARHIGLVLPRFLLRHPYGTRSDEVDFMAFEELASEPAHEHFLWAPGSCAVALALGQAFAQEQGSIDPGPFLQVDDLPLHFRQEDGEQVMQACGETFFSERTAETILQAGLMPLMSHRNKNAVTLLRLQSIAEPSTPLAGPWSR